MKDIKTLEYLEELRKLGSNYGLERTERLLELLGNPQKKLKLIHIAGTNGKGSTSSIIGEILIANGYKVGFYNSPHLEDIEETIRINHDNIKEHELIDLINEVKPKVNKIIEEGYSHPTEFEVLTCLMYLYLYRNNVDFGIIEVGLGGSLDSTNVITPIVSVITPISFDHMNILGNTIGEIAREKAGIIKFNVPVVSAIQIEEGKNVLLEKVKKENTKIDFVKEEDYKFIEIIKEDKIYQRIEVKLKNKYLLDLPLLGEHQQINLTLALKVIENIEENKYVDINKNNLFSGVKNAIWKGRMEILEENPTFLIDGAHNEEGIKYLKKNLEKYFEYKNLYLIIGILKDKKVEEMLGLITPLAKEIYTVTPNSPRATDAKELMYIVKKYNENVKAFDDYNDAIMEARKKAKKEDMILAAGSLYMIGRLRGFITNKK